MEFYFADQGIMACGGIAAAMYTNYPAADQVKTLAACGARLAFAQDRRTVEALRTSPVERWIVLLGEAPPGAMTFDELRAAGRRALESDPALVGRTAGALGPADLAILYMTSGATGEPKMALVTHGAVLANVAMGPKVLPL